MRGPGARHLSRECSTRVVTDGTPPPGRPAKALPPDSWVISGSPAITGAGGHQDSLRSCDGNFAPVSRAWAAALKGGKGHVNKAGPAWGPGLGSRDFQWVFLEAHSLEVARARVCPLVTARWQQCRTLVACRASRGGVPLSGASPGRRGALPAPARPLSALVAAAQGSLSPNPNIVRTRLPSASPAPHMLLDWRGWELEWGDVGGDSTGPQPFLAPPDPQSHGEDWMRGAGGQLTGSLGGRLPHPPPCLL